MRFFFLIFGFGIKGATISLFNEVDLSFLISVLFGIIEAYYKRLK
jgi:hypothetical protein